MRRSMRLIAAPAEPHARIVRMALLEKGLEADVADAAPPMHGEASATRLITRDGIELTATTPILLHLDALAPTPPLLPIDGSDGWRGVAAYSQALDLLQAIADWREVPNGTMRGTPGDAAGVARQVERLERGIESGAYDGGRTGFPDAAWIALAVALDVCTRWRLFDTSEGSPALAEWFDAATRRPSFLLTGLPIGLPAGLPTGLPAGLPAGLSAGPPAT